MTTTHQPSKLPSKYGLALTGSDWAGLPLRIGHIGESGVLEDLSSESDTILVWSGGPSHVDILFRNSNAGQTGHCEFVRSSGAMDLLPRGTRLLRVRWHGEPSICTSVVLPQACLQALCADRWPELDTTRGARFGLVDAHVVDLVYRLQAQAEGEADYGVLYVQSISLALASYVYARYGAGAVSEQAVRRGVLTHAQRQTIQEFVEQELASNFGLVDLASLIGYCPDHFSRLFKQSFEQSPHQYVLSRRIERAKAMLRDGDRPISEIAVACGFANQGHLTTAFKRRTGMTPGTYRKT